MGVNSAGENHGWLAGQDRKRVMTNKKGSGSTERMDKGSRAERMGVEVVLDQ